MPTVFFVAYSPVPYVWAHRDPLLVILTVDGETVETTPEHPFYTAEGEWVAAANLQAGDHVRRADGSYGTVQAVAIVYRPQVMYNLTVAGAHTFFVGHGQWLVHNTCPKMYDIVPYRPTNTASGLANHHGIMDAWAKNNVPGYVSRATGAPTIALTPSQHNATTRVYWEWVRENGLGKGPDWSTIDQRQIKELSERMFDAAAVPQTARDAYYRALNQYLYTGNWSK